MAISKSREKNTSEQIGPARPPSNLLVLSRKEGNAPYKQSLATLYPGSFGIEHEEAKQIKPAKENTQHAAPYKIEHMPKKQTTQNIQIQNHPTPKPSQPTAPHGLNVVLVPEDAERLPRHRAGRHVHHAGDELPGDLVPRDQWVWFRILCLKGKPTGSRSGCCLKIPLYNVCSNWVF